MNKDILIIEYFENTSSLSQIIKIFTGEPYSHTEMIIGNKWCGLNPLDKNKGEYDYHVRQINNKKEFIRKIKNQADVFEVQHEFTLGDQMKMMKFWNKKVRNKQTYGYNKLPFLPIMKTFLKIARKYYIKHGRPLPLTYAGFWNKDTCSNMVDRCLRIGGYDIFPEFDDRIVPPGYFARKLKEYQL